MINVYLFDLLQAPRKVPELLVFHHSTGGVHTFARHQVVKFCDWRAAFNLANFYSVNWLNAIKDFFVLPSTINHIRGHKQSLQVALINAWVRSSSIHLNHFVP